MSRPSEPAFLNFEVGGGLLTTPHRGFTGPMNTIMTERTIHETTVKNLNWPETNQLAICKCSVFGGLGHFVLARMYQRPEPNGNGEWPHPTCLCNGSAFL